MHALDVTSHCMHALDGRDKPHVCMLWTDVTSHWTDVTSHCMHALDTTSRLDCQTANYYMRNFDFFAPKIISG